MSKFITTSFALMILLVTASFSMASEDNITCALTWVNECSPDQGCKEWSIEEMALPRFVRIDLNKKTVTSLDKAITRTSKISAIDRLEGMVVMHGTEQRGWSIALGEDSRNLTLSASGDGEGFIVFGSCIDN